MTAAVAGAIPLSWVPAHAEQPPFYAGGFENTPSAAAMTAIGRALFNDRSLSASGRTSCASCHDPAQAFGPPHGAPGGGPSPPPRGVAAAPATDAPVRRAGADGRQPGVRAVPSLMYAQGVPPFTEHYFDDDGDDSVDQGPAGGRTWDGRAGSAHEQARLPLLSPFEMANAGEDAVAARVRASRSAAALRGAFGASVLDDPALTFRALIMALETYQESPEEFAPYTSKYDAWLRHEGTLSDAELRGLAAFDDPGRGNCARCHPSGLRRGAFPTFTDYGYAALGAPRNAAIPANRDPRHFDLGLCGPLRTDLAGRREYCGMFRTPTLRNVATRRVFFHNGVLHRLEDAVRFYAERDVAPERWYPRDRSGAVVKFDDLPAEYRGNVDVQAPFGGRAGDTPRLSEADVADIVAFLRALTDLR
ncbi:MAG TPA: cytochrome c peroxidase [Steroidobacteraceae bacterium]|nr:cytochrome c peroxidase [Steroidobacteraceae bacterium]